MEQKTQVNSRSNPGSTRLIPFTWASIHTYLLHTKVVWTLLPTLGQIWLTVGRQWSYNEWKLFSRFVWGADISTTSGVYSNEAVLQTISQIYYISRVTTAWEGSAMIRSRHIPKKDIKCTWNSRSNEELECGRTKMVWATSPTDEEVPVWFLSQTF